MKPTKYLFAIVVPLFLAWNSPAEEAKPFLPENITFRISFDNSVNADQAAGEPCREVSTSPEDFIPGVLGKAYLAKNNMLRGIPGGGNFDVSKPGTISFWLKPVAWKQQKDFPDNETNPKLIKGGAHYCLLIFSGDKKGIYLNRCTSHIRGKSDVLQMLAPGTNMKLSGLRDYAFPMDQWTHIVLTWDPRTFLVYLNGKEFLRSSAARTADSGELDKLVFGIYQGSAVDELVIFDKCLSPEEVGRYYEQLNPAKK